MRGEVDWLARMPQPLQLLVLGWLRPEDLRALSCVSRQFHELCQSDRLWEAMYTRHRSGQHQRERELVGGGEREVRLNKNLIIEIRGNLIQ